MADDDCFYSFSTSTDHLWVEWQGVRVCDHWGPQANCMNQFAIDYISEHLGEKTGWVIMDFAGLANKAFEFNVYKIELCSVKYENRKCWMIKNPIIGHRQEQQK